MHRICICVVQIIKQKEWKEKKCLKCQCIEIKLNYMNLVIRKHKLKHWLTEVSKNNAYSSSVFFFRFFLCIIEYLNYSHIACTSKYVKKKNCLFIFICLIITATTTTRDKFSINEYHLRKSKHKNQIHKNVLFHYNQWQTAK